MILRIGSLIPFHGNGGCCRDQYLGPPPRMTADLNRNQQIDFDVSISSLRVNDPYGRVCIHTSEWQVG